MRRPMPVQCPQRRVMQATATRAAATDRIAFETFVIELRSTCVDCATMRTERSETTLATCSLPMEPMPQRTLFGVNLPWFFGAYGHDLAINENVPDWGCDFDSFKSYRPLIE